MDLLAITHFLNGLLMMVLPITISIYLVKRFKASWWLWWMGAGTFIMSQVGHIPFNATLTILFQRGILPAPPEQYELLTNAVILGLSAGLWEEFMRYFTYRWWATKARSWREGLVLGIGHGGIEAIILGALVMVTYISMLGLRNADLAGMASGAQLEVITQRVQLYWNMAWPEPLLGTLERLLALPLHLAFSLLVLQAFTRRRFVWVWLAVLFHAVVDGTVVVIQARYGNLAAEGAVALFTLVSLGIIYLLFEPEITGQPAAPTIAPAPVQIVPVEPDPENIETSRYTS